MLDGPMELAAMFRFIGFGIAEMLLWLLCLCQRVYGRKASAKISNKLNKFLHSEMNLLLQHIREQDQDGQNNTSNNSYPEPN